MVSITLPTFTDFLLARSAARLTKVRDARRLVEASESYRLVDYYLSLRRPLVDMLVSGGDMAGIDDCVHHLSDAKKLANYKSIRDGLAGWAGQTTFEGRRVRRSAWRSGDLTVKVHPQARIKIAGQWHVVYCYLKGDKLDRFRVQSTLHLLNQTHGQLGTPMLLEARTGKTFGPGKPRPGMDALLRAEAMAFVSLWEDDLDAA